MADAIRVDGLADLQRAFTAADKALRQDLRDALEEAAQPVRRDAQLGAATITHMTTVPWTRMRTGIIQGTVVYVAPVERGATARANQSRRRPRFKNVLGPRMDLALEMNRTRVLRRLDQMLDEVIKVWDRHGR